MFGMLVRATYINSSVTMTKTMISISLLFRLAADLLLLLILPSRLCSGETVAVAVAAAAFHAPPLLLKRSLFGGKSQSTQDSVQDAGVLKAKRSTLAQQWQFRPAGTAATTTRSSCTSWHQRQTPSTSTLLLASPANHHSDDEWHPHDPAWTTPQLLEGLWSQIAQAKTMIRGVRYIL